MEIDSSTLFSGVWERAELQWSGASSLLPQFLHAQQILNVILKQLHQLSFVQKNMVMVVTSLLFIKYLPFETVS